MKKGIVFIGNNTTLLDSLSIRLFSSFDVQLCLVDEHSTEEDAIGVYRWEPASYLSAKAVIGQCMRRHGPSQVVLVFSPYVLDFDDFSSVTSVEKACDFWIKGWLFALKELEPFLKRDSILLTFVLDTRNTKDVFINSFLEKSFFYLADSYLDNKALDFDVRALLYSADLESELCDFISDMQVSKKSKKWQYVPKKRGFLGL